MTKPENIRNGILFFEDCSAGELAAAYGTPLYLMSETVMKKRISEIDEKFISKYDNVSAVFASKAYQTLDMCRLVAASPLGLDVVSGGELFTALKGGVDPEKIYFHGNAKTDEELEMAVDSGVGRIVVDNSDELETLIGIAEKKGKKVPILFRITPGVDSHTHRYISTASLDSKFGIPLERETRNRYVKRAVGSPWVSLKGFHFHVGSQLMENTSHLMALDILINQMAELKEELDFFTQEVNLGGGFGISYNANEQPRPFEEFTDAMMERLEDGCREKNLPRPAVTIEPGRWITAEAGMTLYTVCSVKEIPGVKTWVAVDGGMGDNIRPALYQAEYSAVLAEKASRKCNTHCSVSGRFCESSDILIQKIDLPDPRKGDLLAVFATGAYNFSMASNYNRIRRPAVVLVEGKKHRLSVKRQTFEDLISWDL